MPDNPSLRCYISMKYDAPWLDPVYASIEKVVTSIGLTPVKSIKIPGIAQNLLEQVYTHIDASFLVICEASMHSWFVAFELAHAMKHKMYILILQKDLKGRSKGLGSISASLHGETKHIDYSLESLAVFEAELEKSLIAAIKLSSEECKKIAARLWEHDKISIRYKYITPKLTHYKSSAGVTIEEFRQEWENQWPPRPIALLSQPGTGKTAFIEIFKTETGKKLERYRPFKLHAIPESSLSQTAFPGFILVIKLGFITDTSFEQWPKLLFEEIEKQQARKYVPFDYLCKSGLVYLLLDSLDELGLHPNFNQEVFVKCLNALSAMGIRVLLTCRSWYWQEMMYKYHSDFTAYEIATFDEPQIREFLGERRFIELRGHAATIPHWLRSPLILTFIKEAEVIEFQNKTKIYEAWLAEMIKSEVQHEGNAVGFNANEVLAFYQEVAFLLAKKREYSISKKTCADANKNLKARRNQDLDAERHIDPFRDPRSKLVELKVIEGERNIKGVFTHQTIYEFLVASYLCENFSTAVTLAPADPRLKTMAMAEMFLDYFDVTVYGFLYGKLGREYETSLCQWLAKHNENKSLQQAPVFLVRNLVEYIGMTSISLDPGLIDCLSGLIQNPELDELVQYNAARALARLHPETPRPHFDFASDWGEAVFEKYTGEISPCCAIRAPTEGSDERKPGNSGIELCSVKEQEREWLNAGRAGIGSKLLKSLDALIKHNQKPDLQVNCSYALILWYDQQDRECRELMQAIFDQSADKLNKYVRQNLEVAKDRSRYTKYK